MSDSDFETQVTPNIKRKIISSGKERGILDWEHIADLRKLSPDFRDLFEWAALCLSKERAYAFEDFQKIQSIEKKIYG